MRTSKQNSGGEKLENKEKKPKWWGRKKKIKKIVFIKWQLNSFTMMEFIWPHEMAIHRLPQNSIAIVGWQTNGFGPRY